MRPLLLPGLLDAVARLGKEWYCRVQGSAIFGVPRPAGQLAIGIDQLPPDIRTSKILTGNDLGLLASITKIPEQGHDLNDSRVQQARQRGIDAVHRLAQEYLQEGKVMEAWSILMG